MPLIFRKFSIILLVAIGPIIFFVGQFLSTPTKPYPSSKNYDTKTRKFKNFGAKPYKARKHDKKRGSFAKAFYQREEDIAEKTGFPFQKINLEDIAQLEDQILWIGHSSFLLKHKGRAILMDPIFSKRASPLSFMGPKRVTPMPFSIKDLSPIDIVVISHNHYDHLDKRTIKKLARSQPDIRFFVPLGLADLFHKWGIFAVTELDWWQSVRVQDIEVTATPVHHWSARTPFDRNETLWAGWHVAWDDFSFFFAGDTGYSDDFKRIRQRLGVPDLAAIPIGAYEPRNFMKGAHVNPEESVQMLVDLGSPLAVAMHWGTFKLTLEKLAEPPKKLRSVLERRRLKGQDFLVLRHGESVAIRK